MTSHNCTLLGLGHDFENTALSDISLRSRSDLFGCVVIYLIHLMLHHTTNHRKRI